MMLTRLAHPFHGRTLEFMFGADRTRIARWTNACLIWFFDEFNHLLQLNIERFVERAPEYAAAVARKMGSGGVERPDGEPAGIVCTRVVGVGGMRRWNWHGGGSNYGGT